MRIIATLICIILATLSQAQLKVGVRAAVNLSEINGNAIIRSDQVLGYTLALVGEVKFISFGVQPELHFTQRGGSYQAGKVQLNYIELPILFKYSFFGTSIHPYILAGPSIGALIETAGSYRSNDHDLSDFDFSAHLGAGINLGRLFTDLRYVIGFTDIGLVGPDGQLETSKNVSWQLGLGIWF